MMDRNFQLIETNGVTLRTVVEGEGPLLVLLHGFPQCWYLWRNQIDPLVAAGYRVAVPDQRGYGGSSCPPAISDYDIRKLTGDVAGIASALGYDEFTVIGHDWGCVVAWNTALLHEDTCKAVLGLSVPYARGTDPDLFINPPGMDDRFWYVRYFQQPGVAEAEMEGDIERTLRAMYYTASSDAPAHLFMRQLEKPRASKLFDVIIEPETLPAWLTRQDLDYYVAQFQISGFRGPVNWYRNIPTNNAITPELHARKILQPAAFVAGSDDDALLFSRNWRKNMPNWFEDLRSVDLVEGAAHWVQMEQPEETNELILRFLGGL